jgi:hypothetical protein
MRSKKIVKAGTEKSAVAARHSGWNSGGGFSHESSDLPMQCPQKSFLNS